MNTKSKTHYRIMFVAAGTCFPQSFNCYAPNVNSAIKLLRSEAVGCQVVEFAENCMKDIFNENALHAECDKNGVRVG